MIIKVMINWCSDDLIKSSSRKRRQICSKTVVRPKALLSFHFISSPDVVKRYLNMVVVVVNQSCHQDNMVFTHTPSMIMLDVAYVQGSVGCWMFSSF